MRLTVTSVALALVCLVGAAPAFSQKPDDAGPPDWLEQAKIVAQMDGVSVGEAVRRAKLQQRMAEAEARLSENPNYAGSYIDRRGNGFKIVHRFKGAGAKPSTGDAELDTNSQFEASEVSMKELRDFQRVLSTALNTAKIVATITYDVPNGKLIVQTNDRAKIDALRTGGLLTIPAFVSFLSGSSFFGTEGTESGGGYLNGPGGSCTAGFSVRQGTTGPTGLSTANHCIPYGLTSHKGVALGSNSQTQAYQAGVTDAPDRDVTWYRNDANTYNNAVYVGTSFYLMTQVGPQSPGPGTSICVVKQNDTQQCAYVSAAQVPPGGFYPVVIMDRHITIGGDSGGPWIYSGIAYGTTRGPKCDDQQLTVNCKSTYVPATTMAQVIGINVLVK